ncbi:head GIN domain-containing protein [Labilibacter marinus]|uniref:head GIN domain-containing protein n=1 Tax=Labilibacter marinus TaxID=1477105 RepID=UPI000835E3CB|nr:head GIN domain-containing protein [Labilibacter marinus]
MKSLRIGIIAIVFASFLISCQDNIEGTGPVITKELDVMEFDSFELDGSFDVEVHYGEEQKVVAVGQENIIDRLNTWVDNDHWNIQLENGNYRHFSLKVIITIPSLRRAIVDGSGDIRIESALFADKTSLIVEGSGNMDVVADVDASDELLLIIDGSGNISASHIETTKLDTRIEGSGNISLAGEVDTQSIVIDGSGNYKAFDLTSDTCNVRVEGSGNVQVTVGDRLNVNIEGSGDVHYKGDAITDINIDGSGRVKKVG